VDVVICAMNEAPTIAGVVAACRNAPGTSRVIVVDDRSKDGTGRIAKRAGAHRVITGPGTGKGQALTAGMELVTTDRVVFVDADLTGLTAEHVELLCQPHDGVIIASRSSASGRVDLTIDPDQPLIVGHAYGRPGVYHAGDVLNSGQRSMPARLPRMIRLTGYYAEMQLHWVAAGLGLPVGVVSWSGVADAHHDRGERAWWDREENQQERDEWMTSWGQHELPRILGLDEFGAQLLNFAVATREQAVRDIPGLTAADIGAGIQLILAARAEALRRKAARPGGAAA
jgi:glycosyltransferase involved in cell wall biosynthesis